ncbi:hypothetical protein [uncultured Clostridium sp.]|uniref:hypothetical protein n=1 Tax=uncultured Clostridium sp. TaxID=59620 RepID=UPI0028EBC80A|nr:hypothetical protein [uncultured Clostridium sp.]
MKTQERLSSIGKFLFFAGLIGGIILLFVNIVAGAICIISSFVWYTLCEWLSEMLSNSNEMLENSKKQLDLLFDIKNKLGKEYE